jgi:hypothetical protein
VDAHFVGRAHFSGVQAELFVNEVPAGIVFGTDQSPVIIPIDHFLLRGQNRFTVVVHVNRVASRTRETWTDTPAATTYQGSGSLVVAIERYGSNVHPAFSNVPPIASVRWEGVLAPEPFVLGEKFPVVDDVPAWAWTRADRVSLTDRGIREEIVEYVRSLHTLLRLGRFDEFVNECDIKLAEVTSAFGWTEGRMRDDLAQRLREYSVLPYVLEFLSPEALDLRAVAGGRLVQCVRGQRQPPLQFRHVERRSTFSLPLMVGRFAGRWRVLR